MAQILCAWRDKPLGSYDGDDGISHGICRECWEIVCAEEGLLDEGEVESFYDATQGDVEAEDSEGYGKHAMGPDASEWERSGLGEGEGLT